MNLGYQEEDEDMLMMDDEYRFRAFLIENNLSDPNARKAFKNDYRL